MTARTTEEIAGARGTVALVDWPLEDPRRVVVIAHGYGEHIGRYEHVAEALREHGAAVFGLDHHGHGSSEGEPALVEDFEDLLVGTSIWSSTARPPPIRTCRWCCSATPWAG